MPRDAPQPGRGAQGNRERAKTHHTARTSTPPADQSTSEPHQHPPRTADHTRSPPQTPIQKPGTTHTTTGMPEGREAPFHASTPGSGINCTSPPHDRQWTDTKPATPQPTQT